MIAASNRIVVAIREHVVSDYPLPGAYEDVGVDEPAHGGVVITAVQIIELRLFGMGVAKRIKKY